MYKQTNIGLLCCVGSGSNVPVPLYRVVNLKVDHILMSNLFTKIYNMLYYTTNLYLQ